MKAFSYVRPASVSDAVAQLTVGGRSNAALAGGVDMLDLLKEGLVAPDVVVSLSALPNLEAVETLTSGAIRIGAKVRLSDLASNATITAKLPALAESAAGAATPQVRNLATAAGNLLQRPRCWYFRNSDVPCLKKGGTTCPAVAGDNRYLAILGGSGCYAVSASSTAISLVALGAVLNVTGTAGARTVSLDALYVSPSVDPTREHTLKDGDVITSIEVPAQPVGSKQVYHKFRAKETFDWAMAEAAVRLTVSNGKVTECRLVLGGVAPTPWRATEAEALLVGKAMTLSLCQQAASLAVQSAKALSGNAYKIPVTKTLVEDILKEAAGL